MWYFAWMLGLPFAAMFAVINAMWLEMESDRQLLADAHNNDDDPV